MPWDVDVKTIHRGGWMGREPISLPAAAAMISRGIKAVNPKRPTEDPDEGCPAGYHRSVFIASLMPYLRRRDGNGGRVANLMLDRTEDDLIVQLAMLFEEHQERFENYRAEVMFDG